MKREESGTDFSLTYWFVLAETKKRRENVGQQCENELKQNLKINKHLATSHGSRSVKRG